jgi:hypothetical protein
MCLTLKKGALRKKAKRSRTVYKVGIPIIGKSASPSMMTPYFKFTYNLGKEVKSILRKHRTVWAGDNGFVVQEGLHAFINKQDAVNFVKRSWNLNLAVFECIVPTGSAYYTGTFHDGDLFGFALCDSIASNKIVVNKRLD